MQVIIQKIVATEAEAKELVRQARAEADQILLVARERMRQVVAEARRQAANESERILREAVAGADQKKQACLNARRAEIEQAVRLEEPARQQYIAAALACLRGRNLNSANDHGTGNHT